MSAAELVVAQVLYLGGAVYLAAVFVDCVLAIRRDAQNAANASEHPNKARSRTNTENASGAT